MLGEKEPWEQLFGQTTSIEVLAGPGLAWTEGPAWVKDTLYFSSTISTSFSLLHWEKKKKKLYDFQPKSFTIFQLSWQKQRNIVYLSWAELAFVNFFFFAFFSQSWTFLKQCELSWTFPFTNLTLCNYSVHVTCNCSVLFLVELLLALVGIGSPDRPPSKQCGGWWVVGGGWWVVGRWWVKKKLVGRKILSVVKLVGEIWWVVGGGSWVVGVGGGSCSPFWPNSYQLLALWKLPSVLNYLFELNNIFIFF